MKVRRTLQVGEGVPLEQYGRFDATYGPELAEAVDEDRWNEVMRNVNEFWSSHGGAGLILPVCFGCGICCLCPWSCGLSCLLLVPCLYWNSRRGRSGEDQGLRDVQAYLDNEVSPSTPGYVWVCNRTPSERTPYIEVRLANAPGPSSNVPPTQSPPEDVAPEESSPVETSSIPQPVDPRVTEDIDGLD